MPPEKSQVEEVLRRLLNAYVSRVRGVLSNRALSQTLGSLAEVEAILPDVVGSLMGGEISAGLQAVLEEQPGPLLEQPGPSAPAVAAAEALDKPDLFFEEATKILEHLEAKGAIDREARAAAVALLQGWGESPAPCPLFRP